MAYKNNSTSFQSHWGPILNSMIYKYGLRLSKLELEPGLHSPCPLSLSLYKGKLLCGKGHGGEIKKYPCSISDFFCSGRVWALPVPPWGFAWTCWLIDSISPSLETIESSSARVCRGVQINCLQGRRLEDVILIYNELNCRAFRSNTRELSWSVIIVIIHIFLLI